MPYLKSRTQFPPGGWRWTQPETGWQAPANCSFDRLVNAILTHRKANAHLAQQSGWALTYDEVADEVDRRHAQWCADRGYTNFLKAEVAPPPKSMPSPTMITSVGRAADVAGGAGHARKTAAGVNLLLDWLGEGLTPVPAAYAERRAAICAACPQNHVGDLWQRVDSVAASGMKKLVEVKGDLKLSTSHDAALKTCLACDCWLPLKVWVPMDHIRRNTSADVYEQLDPSCWIRIQP